MIAYRNPPGVLDPRRLSPREREVAAYVAQGMSQKAVAAELGIRASTVASVAGVLVRKLGLLSTTQLPLFWRDTAGHAVALGRSDVVALYCSSPLKPGPDLTPAEREVLSGIVQGRSNRQIRGLSGHEHAHRRQPSRFASEKVRRGLPARAFGAQSR